MARLCIRVADNRNPDNPAMDAFRTQPGDVVSIVGDAHVFSPAERLNGQYRIIDVPGATEADLSYLVQSKNDAEGLMIARRSWRLDEAALKAGAWAAKTEATKAEVDAIVKAV